MPSESYQRMMPKKPDASIPTEEWEALTQDERDFAQFIYDIYDHFDLVVEDKLGWEPSNIRINQGKGNIVIAFDHQDQSYVFRVPKYGQRQLKITMSMRRILSEKAYFPELFYVDGKCLIEEFASGQTLSEETPAEVFAQLAEIIADIHCFSGVGFGGLKYNNIGMGENITSYYTEDFLQREWKAIDRYTQQFETIIALKALWSPFLLKTDGEMVMCHGDMWGGNVLYDADSKQLTLIDWDTAGIYHRERDLHFLISENVTEEQRQTFLDHYPHPVDTQWLHWYRLTMQIKHWSVERHHHFLDAANDFLTVMGSELTLVGPSSDTSLPNDNDK